MSISYMFKKFETNVFFSHGRRETRDMIKMPTRGLETLPDIENPIPRTLCSTSVTANDQSMMPEITQRRKQIFSLTDGRVIAEIIRF